MKKRQKLLITLFIILLGFFFWWKIATAPVNTANTSKQVFVVEKGAGIRAIANNLKKAKLIKSPLAFFITVKELGIEGKIQAGDFRLSESQNTADIAKTLTTGILDVWITVPEGWRADEIADALQEKIPTYQTTWRQALNSDEGYLFPDTYLIPHDATLDSVLNQMKSNFDTKYQELSNKYAPPFSEKKIVTIASMVEREAKTADDQKLVASVIINRLNIGMALQIDATIQYAIGSAPKWWPVLPDSGQNVVPNSPYNTYTNAGLPPTPIANPGLGALTAVINPIKTDYLYYITDKNGVNHYAKTLEEHEANIKRYGL